MRIVSIAPGVLTSNLLRHRRRLVAKDESESLVESRNMGEGNAVDRRASSALIQQKPHDGAGNPSPTKLGQDIHPAQLGRRGVDSHHAAEARPHAIEFSYGNEVPR